MSSYATHQLPNELHFDAIDSWWNGTHEIDVVAKEGTKTTPVASCKWTNAPAGRGELDHLRRAVSSAAELAPMRNLWYALFSRKGFTPDLWELAARAEERVLLFTPGELFEV